MQVHCQGSSMVMITAPPHCTAHPPTLPTYPTQHTHLPYLQGIRVHLLPEASIAIHDDRDVSRDAGRLRQQQHIIIIIIIIIIVVAAGTTTTATTTTAWFLYPRHFLVVSDVQLIFDHRHRYTGVRTSSDGPSCTVSATAAAVSRGSSSSILLAVLDVAIAVVVVMGPDHAVRCESDDHSQSYG